MKKEKVAANQCPYCKRHCSLNNPQCKKGKTLAEEIKKEDKKTKKDNGLQAGIRPKEYKKLNEDEKPKENKKLKEDKKLKVYKRTKEDKKAKEDKKQKASKKLKTDQISKASKSSVPEEVELLELFQNCSAVLLHKKGHKLDIETGNNKRENDILNLPAGKSESTREDLKKHLELSSADLEELLSKLKKKEYIYWKKEDALDSQDTQLSLTKAGLESLNTHIIERNQAEKFSVLNEEEKRYLEKILKKLYLEWSHEQDIELEQDDVKNNP